MVRGTSTNLTPDSILAIFILDSDGRRVLAKYYPALPTTTGSSLVSHSGHLTSGRDAGPKGEKGSIARGNPWPTIKEQKALEKGVWDKAKRATASEILLYDSHVILHRPSVDVTFFLVCTPEENEIMMWNVLGTVVEAMQGVVRGPLEKRTILENIDTVLLALDEAIDDGAPLDTDPSSIISRVTPRTPSSSEIPLALQGLSGVTGIPITEQTIAQGLQAARDALARGLLK